MRVVAELALVRRQPLPLQAVWFQREGLPARELAQPGRQGQEQARWVPAEGLDALPPVAWMARQVRLYARLYARLRVYPPPR